MDLQTMLDNDFCADGSGLFLVGFGKMRERTGYE